MPEWIFGSLQVVKEIKIALRKDSQIVFGFYKYLCLVFVYKTNSVEHCWSIISLYLFSEEKNLIFQ